MFLFLRYGYDVFLFDELQRHGGALSGRHAVEEHLAQPRVEGLPLDGTPSAFVQEALGRHYGLGGLEDGEVGMVAGTDESASFDAEDGGGVVAHLGDY